LFFFLLCGIYLNMHQTTAPDRAFLQKMPHGVAQINAAASDNARLIYQPQRAPFYSSLRAFLGAGTLFFYFPNRQISPPNPPCNFSRFMKK
jgi:hypothetical protein